MTTQSIHFHNEMRTKNPEISLNICFLELAEEFPRDSKRIQISHGIRVIDVRGILYFLLVKDKSAWHFMKIILK